MFTKEFGTRISIMISYISSGRKKWLGWTCNDPDIIRCLEERISFFRSRGTRFVYTRHNVRPHYANGIISRAYDIIESQSDIVVHMGRFSRDEFLTKYPDSQNVVIPHHIYQYTYKEDISVERARSVSQPLARCIHRHGFRKIPQP